MRLRSIALPSIMALGLLIPSICLYAQQKPVVTEQVDVIRQYKPVLGDAIKLKRSPSFSDGNLKNKVQYKYRDIRLKNDTAHAPIEADSLGEAGVLSSPLLYVKLGGGNRGTTLAEVYLNSKPSQSLLYGASFRHLGQSGSLKGQQLLKEQIDLYGKNIFAHNFLSATANISSKRTYFYGYDHELFDYSRSSMRQALRNIEAQLEFGNNPDTARAFTYGAKIRGYTFFASNHNKENHFDLSGIIGYKAGEFSFNLATALNYNRFNQENGEENKNSLFQFNPYILVENKLFRAKLGMKAIKEFGDISKGRLFPDISVDIPLLAGFNLYGGIKGDVTQNTFKGLTSMNPWLRGSNLNLIPTADRLPVEGIRTVPSAQPSIPSYAEFLLQNTRQKFAYFAGIKGAFSPSFNYRMQLDGGYFDKFNFFINQTFDARYFSVVYDANGTTKEEVYAELNYLSGDKFRLNFNIDLLQFKLKSLNQPWHTPKVKGGLELNYNPSYRWKLTGSLYYTAQQQASILNSTDHANLVLNTLTVPGYTDLNLGARYQVTKKFSVFINGNNLLNNHYQVYLNYPVVGLNIFGGIGLSF